MKISFIRPVTGILILAAILLISCAENIPEELLIVPEKTNYEATSTHADVMQFVNTIKEMKSSKVHVEIMAVSVEGREVPLVVLAEPKITTPGEAVSSGKPVIYVQGNIHAGEVEGKEALLLIMRDILYGDKKHLLDDQILLISPIYNADGNDNMSEDSRRSQHGSPKLAGQRSNGQGLDLNRDGIKAEGVETQGLLKNVLIKWDPVLLVDLHTTNGTMHGYSLTYAPNYPSAGHTATSEYVMDTMLPYIRESVKKEYDLDMYLYGGFRIGGRGGQEWPPKTWDLWSILYQPRFMMNYVGLRNMMGILSETFAYDPFDKRILSAKAFTSEILEYTNKHGRDMRETNRRAAEETVRNVVENAGTFTMGVKHRLIPYGDPFTLLTYKYTEQTDSTSGRVRWRATDELVEIPGVQNMGWFEPDVERAVPRGYIFPAELSNIADKLMMHGIDVKTLESNVSAEGEEFIIESFQQSSREYQGHRLVSMKGSFVSRSLNLPEGSYYVDMAQPLASLVFYMLEPESDDGLVVWNYFDEYLKVRGVENKRIPFPVFKYYSINQRD